MTDREKAIVMAYTGKCMLTGDKFQIFHKYVEDIMGRPIWTHEMGLLADEIKEKSEADFMALCGCRMVEPQESDHKCQTCKHYTSGENDGSCGSYICKEYSNWESEG